MTCHFRKRLFCLLLFMISCSHLIYSNNPSKASITIYRDGGSMGLGHQVYLRDSLITKLRNHAYYELEATPGELQIKIKDSDNTFIRFKAEANHTYYLRYNTSDFFDGTPASLTVADSSVSVNYIQINKLNQIQRSYDPRAFVPENKIQFTFNVGIGFYNRDIIELDNGQNSSISFGGGCGLNASYIRQLSKNLEVEFGAGYHLSALQPQPSNANIFFSRFDLSLTPYLVFPIGSGNVQLKFGAGPDKYLGSRLIINTTDLNPGVKSTWRYSSSQGYHISALCEFAYFSGWTAVAGLKYRHVNFHYESSSNNYIPTDDFFTNPSGDAIDLVVGACYHF